MVLAYCGLWFVAACSSVFMSLVVVCVASWDLLFVVWVIIVMLYGYLLYSLDFVVF